MSLLFRILRATHARGTHHKLALDALTRMRRRDAESWRRVFLKHAELYLQGAKAPDDEFKDFENHVLHPRDGYWGGAPEKVESWYGHLVAALKAGQWSEAVWCAGVLSHYFTDPLHPFHTAQSEAENNIHRATEWSISRGYDGLYAEGLAAHGARDFVLPDPAPHWIKSLVCACADAANAEYERLIAHYDINRGVVQPVDGLDHNGRRIVAELLVTAATGFARLLERAIDEAGATPPEVSLALDTVLAGLAIPGKLLAKRIADAEDRRAVEAIYDELEATGRVQLNLSEDERVVRELYEAEVGRTRQAKVAARRAERAVATPAAAVAAHQAQLRAAATAVPPPAAAAGDARAAAPPLAAAAAAVPGPSSPPPARMTLAASLARLEAQAPTLALDAAATEPAVPPAAETAPVPSVRPPRASELRPFLAPGDDLVAAPSIGPKTAERFAALGIRKVAEFLEADPREMAARLGVRHISAAVLAEWQDQARLVMTIPGLRGGHAQLLTGAGFRSARDVAEAPADDLCARVLAFASTADGQRILRDGQPPDLERIKSWVENAAATLAA
jgi:hypothetical protein